jgi:hypothetical protein
MALLLALDPLENGIGAKLPFPGPPGSATRQIAQLPAPTTTRMRVHPDRGVGQMRLTRQLTEERHGLLEIGHVKAFGELAMNRAKKRLAPLAL